MASLPDPLATASAPISAYMSGHESANLAYVKHFGKKMDAVSATFKSLNSQGFNVAYKTADGAEHEVFIEYNAPVTKREDVRPVLEDMAKEAETALGMPSSMNGPPPFKAMMKAAAIEDAQNAEIKRLHEDKGSEKSAVIDSVFGTDKEPSTVPLDVFYPTDKFWQLAITLGLGSNALLAYGSDEVLQRFLPSFAMSVREYLTPGLIRNIFHTAMVIHLLLASVAFGVCLRRGWYSPLNLFKWTGSAALYGSASLIKLFHHGKEVKKAAKKAN